MVLVARHDRYLDETVEGVKVSEGAVTSDVRILMKKGGVMKGRVVDPDGRPVAAARITATDISSRGMRELRATSGRDGSFVLENVLSDDKIEIEAEHADFAPLSKEVPVNTKDFEVVLKGLTKVTWKRT